MKHRNAEGIKIGLVLGMCMAAWTSLSAASTQAAGPLRVNRANPRYFEDHTGKTVYLTGSHNWASLQDIGLTNPPPAFDFAAYLDFLQSHDHNFIRLWRWEFPKWMERAKQRPFYCVPQPWARSGPGLALDGQPQFDLDRFDEEYFRRLRNRTEAASRRGIYVSIMLFEGWGLRFVPEGAKAHPFHPANNVNHTESELGEGFKGIDLFTLSRPRVTALQEAYVHKVIDTVNDLDNVLYEIANESDFTTTEWQYHMIRFIQTYESTKPKQHPVGMTSIGYGVDDLDRLLKSPADWISPNPDHFDYKNNPPPSDGTKVIVLDTDHLWGVGGGVTWVWKSFLRGHNPIWMDPLDKISVWEPTPGNAEAVRRNLGCARRFAERMNLTVVKPHPELASSGYCLANPGSEYLVYQPQPSEPVTVELKAGTYLHEWFNPATGLSAGSDRVEVRDGRRQFKAPFDGESVLYLTVQSAAGVELEPDSLWRHGSPESQGFSAVKLEALRAGLVARNTKALLVLRNDTIVCEWYAPGQNSKTRFGTASLAKALVGGVSFAVALSDGRMGLDDPATRFIRNWRDDPRKSRITLRQLGSHTSGIEDAEADNKQHDQLTGWKGDFWKHLAVPNDPFTVSRDRAPLVFEPGTEMRYSNPGIALLTYCVTASLRGAPQDDIRSLLHERVLRPIGVPDAEWSVGYGKTSNVDGLPLVGSWGGATFTARATARVGRLMLRGGDWDGKRLLNSEAVRLTTSDVGTPGPCGIGWWSNNEDDCPKLPRDAFFGSGAGHQILLVIPSLNLIVVRFGSTIAETGHNPKDFHEPYRLYLFEPLMDALANARLEPAPSQKPSAMAAPYPPSPDIARLEWAPKDTIVRQARGSDNWPLTWAEDDALYGAYGDGNGFEPFTPEKLSMGFARITGGPLDAAGTNLPSTGETRGDGPRGKKASGMLCVNETLYLLARNVGNSQIGWSTDHSRTWTWADWKFTTSFGCPTFLSFGKNYSGALDRFVYLFSPDQDNAYEPADRMVLARAPQDQLRNRSAYEFFVSLAADGRPVWSKDIAERGAVFTHPGRCYRSGITYNEALRRYLWVQILPRSRHPQGPRFQGGFGVYDAPEPWGPWTTIYFTEDWDVGPGETGSFPPKWMSSDGRVLTYVFSGDDSFSVRRATLVLKTAEAVVPGGDPFQPVKK